MKVALHTLGCKLNYAETSSVADQFRSNGFTVSDISNINDVIVINLSLIHISEPTRPY